MAAKQQLGEMRVRLGFLGIVLSALGVVALDTNDLHKQFVSLAASNGGVIPLDADLFDKFTAPDRTWSATVQLTALGKAMKCTPCRYTHYSLLCPPWSSAKCGLPANSNRISSWPQSHGQRSNRISGVNTCSLLSTLMSPETYSGA